MAPSRRLAALAAITALALAACASNDAKGSDVVSAMEDAGLDEDFPDAPECMGDEFEREFSQDELNDLGSADDPEDFPAGTEETVDSIIEQCTTGGGTGDESDTGDEGTESTTTTTAEGE
jgi:hypothetical protein